MHLPMIPHSKAVELITGMKFQAGHFLALGNRVFNMERMFNVREGLVIDTLPKRITDEEQVRGRPETKVQLAKMLPGFYGARGWDKRGIPTRRTLKFLGLDFTAGSLPPASAKPDELQRAFLAKRFSYEANHAHLISERRKLNQKLRAPRPEPSRKPAVAPPKAPEAKPPKKPLLELVLAPRAKSAKKPRSKPAAKPKAGASKKPKK